MNNSQQLFEINKRINQIKRDLQIRSQKAHQWSVPYQKILKKAQLAQNLQVSFSPYQKNQKEEIFQTKQQKKQHLQQKAKQSRYKINNFHNQLKQLQQLQQRKTKLYVKKQDPQQVKFLKQKNNDKRTSSMSKQLKITNKAFNTLMANSGIFSKTLSHSTLRTSKDRINPFTSIKPELIVEIFQQAKQSGKQNMVNQSLGMGLEFTPISHIMRRNKKDDDMEHKILAENDSTFMGGRNDGLFVNIIKPKHNKNHLQKILGSKVSQQRQIYMQEPDQYIEIKHRKSEMGTRKSLNMFEQRMKKLLQEKSIIQKCQGNYAQLLKQQRRANNNNYCKTAIGKVRANNMYKTVFGER